MIKKNAQKWLAKLQKVRSNPVADTSEQKRKIDKATSKYQHQDIKAALVAMFHGKCAYCESKIDNVDYGDIEHFRPKANPDYMSFTFKWSNLLYSCKKCNGAQYKGTKFPLDLDGNHLLIDPTDDATDPFVHLEFSWDKETKLANVDGSDPRGSTVEHIFDLNGLRGRKELLKHGSKYIQKLLCFLVIVLETDNSQHRAEAIEILKDSCQPSAEYSAFALVHILPYLAHHFRDPEAIALLQKVSQRSAKYSAFVRVDDLHCLP